MSGERHLDAEALRTLLAREPGAVAYFREHLAQPCDSCERFLMDASGPELLDGRTDALLLGLAPAREEPRLDEVGLARIQRALRGPAPAWRRVATIVALAAGLACLVALPRLREPPAQELPWDGIKGAGQLSLELSVVARGPEGALRRMDPGNTATDQDVLVLRYHATELGEALLFQQRGSTAPELLGRFPLAAGTHELTGDQGLVGVSLEGEAGPMTLWLVGFPSGQVPPTEGVRKALAEGVPPGRHHLSINRFDFHVQGGQDPRAR